MKSAFDNPEYQGCYPVPHLMRRIRSDWWFRIHSLPESKRYPENDADWHILMDRHKQLSDFVLQHGAETKLVYAQCAGFPFPTPDLPVADWQPLRRIGQGEDARDTWFAHVIWDFEAFSTYLRKIADCRIGGLGFHSVATDAMYMPYDGGADIFTRDPRRLAAIRAEFGKWASTRSDGL